MSGCQRISGERFEQVNVHGWTPEHDDEHASNELIRAAIAYLMEVHHGGYPDYWPWDEFWWKPSDDPVRNLVKAGALIAAEIDRLGRRQ